VIAAKKSGPQTAIGKTISAKNSTKHGLTSNNPSSLKEKETVSRYIQDLTVYYKPKSPLEKIQIERIAICKTKLDRLYEVEQVQLQLAIQKFNKNPDLVLDQIELATGVVRGMVKELIEYGELTLPCYLKDDELEVICEEINLAQDKPKTAEDLPIYYPKLCLYLEGYRGYGRLKSDNLIDKLRVVSERLECSVKRGDQYQERMTEYVDILLRAKFQLEQKDNISEEETELDDYIKSRDEARRKQHQSKKKEEVVEFKEPLIDQVLFEKQLKLFTDLLNFRKKTFQVFEQYQVMKNLMVGGVVLPQAESDLFMRYQTALDRRLSSGIGELLHLQSRPDAKIKEI